MEGNLNDLAKINEEFADLRKSFGGNQFVLVPPYGEEPMVMNECHQNVTKIQLERGGRSVLGFNILQEESTTFINHHSVWETPTGSLVDVTLDEPMGFLPVKYFDANKEFYFTPILFQFPTNTNVVLSNPVGKKWIEKPRGWLRDTDLCCVAIHHRNYPRNQDVPYLEYLVDYHNQNFMEVA
jgi:hypothetical protein